MVNGIETIRFGRDVMDVFREMDTKTIKGSSNVDITSFARLLAKIGYSYAVAEFGLFPREEIPLLPLILGHADNASVWLGSSTFQLTFESDKPLHAMSLIKVNDPRDINKILLIARIKLFVPSGATGYEVIIHQSNNIGA